MSGFKEQELQKIDDLAKRYHVSREAVTELYKALVKGKGSMAQFSHPDLGGSGQWMKDGMTMVGDMFNEALKSKVEHICENLSDMAALHHDSSPKRGNCGNWWPGDLGSPNSSGSQNGMRYAYFAKAHRLAIEVHEEVTIYDTLDHDIFGVSQQQVGSPSSVTFISSSGRVQLKDLPVISKGKK